MVERQNLFVINKKINTFKIHLYWYCIDRNYRPQ